MQICIYIYLIYIYIQKTCNCFIQKTYSLKGSWIQLRVCVITLSTLKGAFFALGLEWMISGLRSGSASFCQRKPHDLLFLFLNYVFYIQYIHVTLALATQNTHTHIQNCKNLGWGRYNLPRKMVTENGCLSKLGQAPKTFRRKSKVYFCCLHTQTNIKCHKTPRIAILVGGFNPFEKYYSTQIGSFTQIRMKIKHVWNHDLVFLDWKRPKHTHGSLEDSTIIGGYLKFRICRNTSLDPTGSMVTGIFT